MFPEHQDLKILTPSNFNIFEKPNILGSEAYLWSELRTEMKEMWWVIKERIPWKTTLPV